MKKNSLLILKERVGIVFRGNRLNDDELNLYTNSTKSDVLNFLRRTGRDVLGVYENVDMLDCLMAQLL